MEDRLLAKHVCGWSTQYLHAEWIAVVHYGAGTCGGETRRGVNAIKGGYSCVHMEDKYCVAIKMLGIQL